MYTFEERVRYSETSEDRKASLVSIINYFQDCCNFEAEEGGVGLDWLSEHHTAWMLTAWQIRILRRPELCERIKVTTWASGFKFFMGKRNFTIETESGELLVYAESEWAYVNVDTGMPCKDVPEKELEVYGISKPLDKEFIKGKLKAPKDDEMVKCETIKVSESNIDAHHHVNNGQYVKLAMSVLPDKVEESAIKTLWVQYKAQSKLGDTLLPYYVKEEDGYKVVLKGKDEKVRLIAKFIL